MTSAVKQSQINKGKVRSWGNSLGLRIPASLAQALDIHDGTPVDIHVDQGSIVIRPRHFEVPDLATLIKQTKRANHPALDTDGPVGKEML